MVKNKLIHITFDYELFFGSHTGSVSKCLLQPTNALIELGKKHNIQFVFFIDAGYIWRLQQLENKLQGASDYKLIASQLQELVAHGHEIALHIHPHWEDSFFIHDEWKIDVSRYKLADFKPEEVANIFAKYHQAIKNITGQSCSTYRAGGWCVQPFQNIKDALLKENIFVDSSVYKNGFHLFTAQFYDFRLAPDKTEWKFAQQECVEDPAGPFTEIAITPHRLSPLFYWNLYLRMKLNPEFYKPIGDGSWLKDKKKLYKQFYSYTNHFACCDGYFASKLKAILLKLEKEKKSRMVILGHPKSLANCSFKYLEDFIVFSLKKGYSISTIRN